MKKILIFCIMALVLHSHTAFAYSISAEYACCMIAETGEVVYEKNAYSRHAMASTTKIMTALPAIEKGTLDDTVTVSKNAAGQEGSSVYLRAGDKINMKNLLYGLMLNSGNDAAVAVAEHVSGSVEQFAVEMTEKAHAIGAKSTQFKNPNGLDADGHYTTAYDLALITREALKQPAFKEIVSTKSIHVPLENNGSMLYLSNHNKMLQYYEGATGVKTGFTKATGRCLVSSAERDGVEVIAVTLNAPDDWNDHTKMLDDAFEKYERVQAVQQGMVVKELSAGETPVNAVLAEEVSTVCRKGTKPQADITLHLAERLAGPLDEGEKIGYAEVKTGGNVKTVDVLCDRAVAGELKRDRTALKEAFLRMLGSWALIR